MSELRACPFCECEMEITKIGRSWWRIRPIDGHDDECVFDGDHGVDYSLSITIEEACEDWNARPIEDKLTAELQRLKEENALLREALKLLHEKLIAQGQRYGATTLRKEIKQLLEETK